MTDLLFSESTYRLPLSRVAVIEPPAPLLTASEVRDRLGINDSDAVLSPLIKAVCSQIEPPHGWVGRAFGTQTLEQRSGWFADYWGGYTLRLRFPPLKEILSVKYLDEDGVEQTLAVEDYTITGATGSDVATLTVPYGGSWPSTRLEPEAIRIRYVAGYDHDDPQLDAAKAAVTLAVRNLRSLSARDLSISSDNVPGVGSRNYVVSEVASKVIGTAVDALLQGYRVYT
jgi:hypothetical protein